MGHVIAAHFYVTLYKNGWEESVASVCEELQSFAPKNETKGRDEGLLQVVVRHEEAQSEVTPARDPQSCFGKSLGSVLRLCEGPP
jgi:hypothetical protein